MFTTLMLAAVLAQPAPTRPAVFLFDYATAQIAADGVNRFELQIDGGAWTDVGRTAAASQEGAPTGVVFYEARVPALTVGGHVAAVRACNAVECSDPVSLKFIISIRPAPVSNLRIGGGQ
jgi:hypothetical protein